MPDPDRETRIDQTDAKAGNSEGVVRWVLAISLGLAIIALTVIWVTGALMQDPVESQMNVDRRIEAQRELTEPEDVLAEEGGMVTPGTEESSQPPAGREIVVASNAD